MNIKINLSVASLDEAIKKVEKYEKEMSEKKNKVCEALADKGVEIAKKEITEMATFGNLADIRASIHKEHRDGKYYVVTRNFKAPYVEFGTGVKGENHQHPIASEAGWGYMKGHFTVKDGKVGWWYPSNAADANTTQVQTENGDLIAFTQGMPARPFMYNTAKKLKVIAPSVIKEVIKK